MAKFLTLNTHSLLGENVEEKLKILGDEIFSGDYDVVCLQEVNQLMTSDTTQDLPGYCPVAGEIAIHEDNYGLQLVRYLAQKGTTYYWSYAYNHVGYDRFNEGVAILSKEPLEASSVLVSKSDDPSDYHTRKMLFCQTVVDGKKTCVASAHFSWLKDGFLDEWGNAVEALAAQGESLVIMGDFNNPANTKQVRTIADGLSEADPERSSAYQNGAKAYLGKLDELKKRQEKLKQEISGQSVILFHEAYAYVAEDYGLQVNYLLDLDEERQVSAGEVSDVLSAVRKGHVKYILAEELYGKSMGDTIRKESDAKVLYLNPLNRGTYEKDSYINGMKKNMEILEEAFYAKDH